MRCVLRMQNGGEAITRLIRGTRCCGMEDASQVAPFSAGLGQETFQDRNGLRTCGRPWLLSAYMALAWMNSSSWPCCIQRTFLKSKGGAAIQGREPMPCANPSAMEPHLKIMSSYGPLSVISAGMSVAPRRGWTDRYCCLDSTAFAGNSSLAASVGQQGIHRSNNLEPENDVPQVDIPSITAAVTNCSPSRAAKCCWGTLETAPCRTPQARSPTSEDWRPSASAAYLSK